MTPIPAPSGPAVRPAAARYGARDGEAEALVARHAPLLDRVARRLASRTGGAVAADDLWAAGALGLLEAARRFEASLGVRFETFAEHRIRGAMLDEMRRMDHLPRRLRARTEQLERMRARLAQSLGREPGSAELAAAMGVEIEEVEGLAAVAQPHLSLLDNLVAPAAATADEALVRAELVRRLADAVSALPERLRLLLSLHYEEGLTYREVAQVLKVSEPRVCQLHGEAVRLLRQALPRR